MSDVDAQIRKTVRQIVREEMRAKVNPTPGGPWTQVWTNAQGQVIKGLAGGADNMIVWHYNNAGSYTLSLPSGTSEDVILYGTPDYDPGSTVDTSGGANWEFTAPATAYYRFELGVQTRSHFWVNGEDCYMFLEENGAQPWGTLWDWNLFPVASTTSPMFMRGVQTISLTAGDVIRPMWGIQLSGAEASYIIQPNWIAIYQV